ncbi:hypothetical protein [Lactococcus allomyrinae]|uniref:Uncharacterized protein n=1 Tax=Lactococcus allomyrinae TaxID=2419773 RepID=A0A387BCZ7_9LACT|nr:hypothetical protein [Lactococcus allomyrinae]AYG01703.1 hypothetical protein D7I46_11950 [Lactococcus allomyrinae]
MSFQLVLGKKPVIFKSGVRMNKKLDKLSTMTLISEDGQEIKHFAGSGAGTVNQFITVIAQPEASTEVILTLLSYLLFSMQNEVAQDEIDDYLDSIDDEETLSQIVQKVYNELPKKSKKSVSQSEMNTAPIALQ